MRYLRNHDPRHVETRRRRRRRPWRATAATLAAAALVAAASASASASTKLTSLSGNVQAAKAKDGGDLTVLEGVNLIGDWPEGLDPATNLDTLLANASMLDAIYGEFFEVGAHNKLIPDLATSYQLTNGAKTLTLHLRHGVKFSDGTPFDASAVVFNFKRDLDESDPANPAWPKYTSISAPNPYTVVVNFSAADGAAATQMLDTTVSWIVSPTALSKMGEKAFALKPVGAGPFVVESDSPSVKLVLKKNPSYWESGHPYLDGLTFESVANDETALEDLEAHDAQAYELMATPQLVSSFKSAGFTVTPDPGTGVADVQLGDTNAPMTNIKAREAVYYAINAHAISNALYKGTCSISESFTGPGGLFYDPKVPGYRSYDLAKAKALVKQLGGLSFKMYYLSSPLDNEEATALHTMFANAGMNVTLVSKATLSAAVAEFDTHKWPAILWVMGSYDPAGGTGVAFFLASNGPFTGIHNPTVDKYINIGATSTNTNTRATAYKDLADYLNKEALSPFICSAESWDIAAKGISGPGLTTAYGGFGEGPLVQWENVSMGG